MRTTFSLVVVMLATVVGCTGTSTYEVRGLGVASNLDAGDTLTVQQSGLMYSIARNAAGLSVIAFNDTDVPVTLVEPGSVSVDPNGRRHVLIERTLLPRTSTRFDLPPRVTGVIAATDEIGTSRAYDEGGILLGPRGGATLRRDDEDDWRWFNGTARLLLIWKPDGGEQLRHELVFDKRLN